MPYGKNILFKNTLSKWRFFFLIFSALLACNACEKEKVPLKGERIALSSLLPQDARSHQKRALQTISLSSPISTFVWEQSSRLPSHDQGHVSFSSNPRHLRQLWKKSIGFSDSDARLLATPVIGKEGIFLVNLQGDLIKVDLQGKNILLKVTLTPQEKQGEPSLGGGCVIDGDHIFVATSWGELIKIQSTSGEILWRMPLQSPARGAPTLEGDQIYVLTLQNQLQVHHKTSGKLLWTHGGMPEGLGILGLACPAVSEDLVVVTYTSGEVYVLRKQTGNPVWSEIISGPRHLGEAQNVSHIRANPVIHNGLLYVISYNGQMAAFNLYNGQRIWEASFASVETPVCDGNVIFLLTHTQEIVALDAHAGGIIWLHSLSQFDLFSSTNNQKVYWFGPVLAGGTLYLLSSNGVLIGLNAQTGLPFEVERSQSTEKAPLKSFASLNLGETFSLMPIVAQETLYTLSDSGHLSAIR